MAVVVYALFALLTLALLAALLLPAPARVADNEAGVHVTLLCAGCLATILTGSLALADLPLPSAVCGAIAWLVVMPCVWLARAPRPDERYDEDDGGDDDGSPPPHRPSAPPAPGDRSDGLRPAGLAPAGALWAPARAPALVPVASAAPALAPAALAEELAAAGPAAEPEPAHRRRLRPRPRRVRADHRSIVHVHAAGAHAAGRRRRASLRLRLLRRVGRRHSVRL